MTDQQQNDPEKDFKELLSALFRKWLPRHPAWFAAYNRMLTTRQAMDAHEAEPPFHENPQIYWHTFITKRNELEAAHAQAVRDAKQTLVNAANAFFQPHNFMSAPAELKDLDAAPVPIDPDTNRVMVMRGSDR